MARQIECSACGESLIVPSGMEGKRLRCRKCQHSMIVPQLPIQKPRTTSAPANEISLAKESAFLSQAAASKSRRPPPLPKYASASPSGHLPLSAGTAAPALPRTTPPPLPPYGIPYAGPIHPQDYSRSMYFAHVREPWPGGSKLVTAGIVLLGLGMMALVLPLFGLSLNWFSHAGRAALIPGWTLLFAAAFCIGFSYLRWKLPHLRGTVGGNVAIGSILFAIGLSVFLVVLLFTGMIILQRPPIAQQNTGFPTPVFPNQNFPAAGFPSPPRPIYPRGWPVHPIIPGSPIPGAPVHPRVPGQSVPPVKPVFPPMPTLPPMPDLPAVLEPPIRPATPIAPMISPPPSTPDDPNVPNIPAPANLKPGDGIEVHWGGSWYKSTVVKIEGDQTFIHYDGWGENFDEWVTRDRIRGRPMP